MLTMRSLSNAVAVPTGTPRFTKDERNGTVVRTRANWDVMRKDAGVYRQVGIACERERPTQP